TYQTMMIINFVSGLLKYTLLPSNKETTDPSTSHSQPHFDVDCLTELMEAFAYTLTRYYIPAHVNETHKKEVTTMFEELRKTVLKSIPKYNWFTDDQRKFVLKKENNSAIYKIKKADFLDEIIADNGALHASFKTYKKLLEKLAGNVSQDRNTTSKHDQSFFRGFAQVNFVWEHRGKGLDEYIYDTPYVLEKN
ncbi:Endothelin-converting enzyme, partial [Schistosoma japonicum]